MFLIITGLFFSRAALSIGMMALCMNAVMYYLRSGRFNILQVERPLLAYASLFLLLLSTGLYSTDKAFFWERARIYLPLLAMPFAFSVPLFAKPGAANKWLLLFFTTTSLTAIWSTVDILTSYKPFSSFTGIYVTTPVNHVRYSLMVSFAIFVGTWLYGNMKPRHRYLAYAILMLTAFLLLYLHLLSVRSGILGFYLAVCFIGLRGIILRRGKNIALVGLILFVFCIGSFTLLPSFSNKFMLTRQSIASLVQGKKVGYLSDFGRLKSIEAGLNLGAHHIWTGVGIGDIGREIAQYYEKNCPELASEGILPHNQFVYVFAATGLLGLAAFVFVVLYPVFYYQLWRCNTAISFNIILLASFQFDHTLETQIGIGFYIFFQLILVQVAKFTTKSQ